MKKVSYFIVILSILVASACGNQRRDKNEKALPTMSIHEQQLNAEIKIQFDSLVQSLSDLGPIPMIGDISNGKITLTDEEKKVKPKYLLPVSKASKAITISQKYRAIVMYRFDMIVAAMYGMPTADYQHVIAKLIIGVNNPAFTKDYAERAKMDDFEGFIMKIYQTEIENGETNHFWDGAVAAIVEQLFILTQNIDKFIVSFDDNKAADVSKRISLLNQSITSLIKINPDMADLGEAMKPLYKINASNVKELQEQLMEIKGEIAIIRNSLL